MAAQPESDKSIPVLATEVWDLVRAYAQQETVEPLKGLGRYAAYGIGGSILLSVGLILLLVGVLRVLQTETGTTFEGSWSWVPYLITLAAGVIVLALVARGMAKRKS